MAGRVILATVVLSQLSVYWAHLFYLPSCTIQRLNKITANFIWGGSSVHRKYHLAKMNAISIPKQFGGWGLNDLRQFGCALLCRTLWRGIFGNSPWSILIRQKYMKGMNIEFWYRLGAIWPRNRSAIWLSMRKIEPYFMSRLRWRLSIGCLALIVIDPILCGHGEINIPKDLSSHLQRRGIFTWNKLIEEWHGSSLIWKDGTSLILPDILDGIWKSITVTLNRGRFQRHGIVDHLTWTVCNAQKPVSVRDIYSDMMSHRISNAQLLFPMVFGRQDVHSNTSILRGLYSTTRTSHGTT